MKTSVWHGDNNVSLFSWLAFISEGCHLHIYLTLVIYNETGVLVVEKNIRHLFLELNGHIWCCDIIWISWNCSQALSFFIYNIFITLEFVKMATSFAAIEDNFVKMMTFVFQSLAQCSIEQRLQKPYTCTMKAAAKCSSNKKMYFLNYISYVPCVCYEANMP